MKVLIIFSLFLCQTALAENLKVATFNTSFRHLDSPKRKVRFEEFLEQLKRLDADVVCLQEIVHTKERARIIDQLDYKFDHHHFSSQTQSYFKWPACSMKQLFDKEGPLYCRYKNCLRMRGDTLGRCLDDQCADSFENLRQINPECSQGQLSQKSTNIVLAFLNLINPFKKVKKFAGTGRDGLLILSKKELSNKDELDYGELSTHRRRGAILADIDYLGKPLKIFCAHLTSNLDGIYPYPGIFDNWQEENRAQIDKIVIKFTPDKPTLVMGSIGCSRRIDQRDVQDNFAGNCAPIFGKGFWEPFYSMKPECTFCPYNNLVTEKVAGGLILDHILVGGVGVKEMNLIFNETVEINEGTNDLEFTYISDHFGLRAVLK